MSPKDTRDTATRRTMRIAQVAPEQPGAEELADGHSTDLCDSPMMARLLKSLEQGEDIGHYGRLTFAIVARFFLDEERLVELLAQQSGQTATEAHALVLQVETHDYSPPTRERILAWQREQEYQICPDPDDPNSGNLYKELRFPDDVYERIGAYYEEQAEAEEQAQGEEGKKQASA